MMRLKETSAASSYSFLICYENLGKLISAVEVHFYGESEKNKWV